MNLEDVRRRGGEMTNSCFRNLHHWYCVLHRLQSDLDVENLGRSEVELKANLFFHIGNPLKRWKIERVVPVKLILQLIKTVCLVVQV